MHDIANQLSGVAGIYREPFELFLIYEARLLDDRRFYDWMELFTEDGYYWVPSAPDQENPFDHASLFYDDRELMKTRIDRLNHPRIYSQIPPSRTSHVIGNVLVEEADETAGEYLISSNFNMTEYRLRNQRIFAGRYLHRLKKNGAGFATAWKKVALINCDAPVGVIAVPI